MEIKKIYTSGELSPVTASYEVMTQGAVATGRFVRVDKGEKFMDVKPGFYYLFRHCIPLPEGQKSQAWRYK